MLGANGRSSVSAAEQRLHQLTDDNAFVDVGAVLGGAGSRRGGSGPGFTGGSGPGAKGAASSRRPHAIGNVGGGRAAQTVVQNANDDEFFDRDEMLQSGKVRQRDADVEGKHTGKRKREDGERERGTAEAQGGALASNPFFRGRINLNAALVEQHRLFEDALRQRRRLRKTHQRNNTKKSRKSTSGENKDGEKKRSRSRSSSSNSNSNSSSGTESSEGSEDGEDGGDESLLVGQMSGFEGATSLAGDFYGLAAVDDEDLQETYSELGSGWAAFQHWMSSQRNHADVHLTRARHIVDFAEVEWMHHSFASWYSTVAASKQNPLPTNSTGASRTSKAHQGQSHNKSGRTDTEEGESASAHAGDSVVAPEKANDSLVSLASHVDPPAMLPLPKSCMSFRDDGFQSSHSKSAANEEGGRRKNRQSVKRSDAVGRGGFHLCSVCQLPAQYRCTRCLRDLFCSIECHVVHEATRCLKFIQ